MLFRRIGSILTTEIKWGRIAGLAAGAALIAVLAAGSSFSMLSLVVFSFAGVFIERIAPRRPYWNSLLYSLMGVLFYTLLLILRELGEGERSLSSVEFFAQWFQVAIVVVPQALIGTWIGVSVRKFTKAAAEARQEGAAPAPKAGPDSPGKTKEPPTPRRNPAASPQPRGQGQRKRH